MKTDTNCIFCQIIVGQVQCFKLFEDDDTIALMDIDPANDGHCLVAATKEHYPTLFDVTDEAFAAVWRSVNRVARAVNPALSPVGLNVVQANGPGAEQSVKHFHVHVLPRKRGDQLK
jgi:histidine triad (HIT) family protein